MGKVASHPSAILLFVQLLGVLVYPYIETGGTQSVVFEIAATRAGTGDLGDP